MRRFISRRLHILAILSLLALIAGQFGAYHWFAELFSHFLPYYTFIFLLATIASSGYKRWIWLACTLGSVLWLMQPLTWWQRHAAHDAPDNSATLIWYNINLHNPAATEESAYLLAKNADILALSEMHPNDSAWHNLRANYPYRCEHIDDSPFALALWAKTPWQDCAVYFIDTFPYIRAILADGTALYVLHPPPPINPFLARAREKYLRLSAQSITLDERVIAVGDFNSSPFSPLFRRFMRDSRTISHTPYWLPTWQPFFLNIDHVFSRHQALTVQPLPWQHSDHRPLKIVHQNIQVF
ncbi:MAG: endonuclease [Cardiobacteriales bacterium]|nr:MAG: endonuclease [Cardiobacteriales bacterium]